MAASMHKWRWDRMRFDGTVVNVNGVNYTVTAADLANGYITAADSRDRRRPP